MATTIYGNKAQRGKIIWGDDFSHNEDDDGLINAKHSFLCHTDEIYKLCPLRGSSCVEPGFGILKRTGVDSEKIGGGISRVTCSYSFYRGKEIDVDADDDGYSYQGGVITSQDSLINHPRYKNIPQSDREIIVKAYDGTYLKTSIPYNYVIPILPEYDIETEGSITSDLGKELIDKLMAGKNETYYKPGQVVRMSYTSNIKPSNTLLAKVGKIYTGKGVSDVGGDKNWLLTGVPFSKANGVYTITLELQLSDDGGWDEDLY